MLVNTLLPYSTLFRSGAAGDLAIVRPAAAAPPNPISLNYAAPDSSEPTSPREKGIPPEMPEEKARRSPPAVLAPPLAVASDPVATDRPRPGQPLPSAR